MMIVLVKVSRSGGCSRVTNMEVDTDLCRAQMMILSYQGLGCRRTRIRGILLDLAVLQHINHRRKKLYVYDSSSSVNNTTHDPRDS